MKLKLYNTVKLIVLSALFISSILCSHTEVKEKINISERFMKNRKAHSRSLNLAHSNMANKNLLQNKARVKNASQNLMTATKAQTQTTKAAADPLANTNIGEMAENLANEGNDNGLPVIDLNIGNGPIYASGWVSFFKYVPTTETKKLIPDKTPRSFVPNGQFEEQFKLYPGFNKEETSSDGINTLPKYIPDKHSFYAVLLKDSMNILTSRQVIINK